MFVFCQHKYCLNIAKYGYDEIRYDEYRLHRFIYIHCKKHKYKFEVKKK